MSKNLTPRYIVIGIILAWALITLWPSVKYQQLSPEDIEDMREAGTLETLENKIIKLGLDLKGGIYIVLEVDHVNTSLEIQTLLNNFIFESFECTGFPHIFNIFRR